MTAVLFVFAYVTRLARELDEQVAACKRLFRLITATASSDFRCYTTGTYMLLVHTYTSHTQRLAPELRCHTTLNGKFSRSFESVFTTMNFVDFLCFLLTDSDVNAKILEGIENQFHKKGKMGSTLEPHPWRNSKAQQVILGLLKSGHIRSESEMTSKTEIEQIWNMYCVPRQEFAGFQFSKFPPRLKAMQKSHAAKEPHPWRDSKAQRIIQSLLESGLIRSESEMTSKTEIEQIWNMYCVPRQEFAGFKFSKFPPRLKAMQKSHAAKEPQPWRDSKAQRIIQSLLESGHIRSEGEMTSAIEIEQIWNMFCVPRQEFAGFKFSNFPPRLKAMQKSHAAHIGHAKVETEILRVHKQHFPTPLLDHRGHPQWHGSDAERFLKADIAARTPGETPIAPKLFYLTRAAYQIYPLDVFRKHIHQEVRLRKLIYQYGNRKVHDDTTTNDSL
jgi:hypothetical protein